MVVSYDTQAELVTDLTDDVRALQKALQGLRPGGGTAISSVPFAPIDASARPGCGPCGIPSGWWVIEPYSIPFRLMNSLDA